MFNVSTNASSCSTMEFQIPMHFYRWTMALAQNQDRNRLPLELRTLDRVTLGLVGTLVIFASLGMGEAVYRLAFSDFDGATDRLPIEMLFGLAFAWMTMKLVRRIYQHRLETSARINLQQRTRLSGVRRIPFLSKLSPQHECRTVSRLGGPSGACPLSTFRWLRSTTRQPSRSSSLPNTSALLSSVHITASSSSWFASSSGTLRPTS